MQRAEHFAAFLSAIPAPVAGHDTAAPTNSDGTLLRASYAVAYDRGAKAPPDDGRLTKGQSADDAVTWRFVVKSVGTTPFAARSVDSAIASALVGRTLIVAGRRCDPIRMDDNGEVKRDSAVSPPLYYTESDYLLRSQRA